MTLHVVESCSWTGRKVRCTSVALLPGPVCGLLSQG